MRNQSRNNTNTAIPCNTHLVPDMGGQGQDVVRVTLSRVAPGHSKQPRSAGRGTKQVELESAGQVSACQKEVRDARPGKGEVDRQAIFDKVWDQLARKGVCDTRPGAEWRRVRGGWSEAGCPADIAAFIRRLANLKWYEDVDLNELVPPTVPRLPGAGERLA